jgi:low affinity Fe/Cu permease
MKKNLGSADKIVRYLIALVAVILFFTGSLSGWQMYAALAVGAVMLITALINFCPLYAIFGIKTCKI